MIPRKNDGEPSDEYLERLIPELELQFDEYSTVIENNISSLQRQFDSIDINSTLRIDIDYMTGEIEKLRQTTHLLLTYIQEQINNGNA